MPDAANPDPKGSPSGYVFKMPDPLGSGKVITVVMKFRPGGGFDLSVYGNIPGSHQKLMQFLEQNLKPTLDELAKRNGLKGNFDVKRKPDARTN